MKKRILFAFFAVVLFCLLSGVTASAKNYNVKLSVSLFSQDSSPSSSWITVDEKVLSELISFGNVEYFEEDILAEFSEYTENDPAYSDMWEHAMIKSEDAWEKGALGGGICVAVIDSGANSHEELSGRIKYAFDYVNGTEDVTDNIGHGTAVAGVIAANRGNGKGFSGVAPRCELAVLKVADVVDGEQYGPYISDVSDAIEDAVDIYGCRVINLSLGSTSESERLKEAVEHALSKGAVIVASTGNDSKNSVRYPAKYDSVLGVGSVGSDGVRSSFSNYGTGINVTAPGRAVNIISGTSDYGTKNGTSFSSPYVAGICAAMLSADPSLERAELTDIIEKTAADDKNADGYDEYYGFGIVDFGKCIDTVIENTGIYISLPDTEDAEIPVFVTNTSRNEENFVLVIEKDGRETVFENITVKKGKSLEISLADIGCDEPKNIFAVTDTGSAFCISANAKTGLSFVPSDSEKSFSLFVTDKNESEMTAILSGLLLAEIEKCNITVRAQGELLHIGEYYAPPQELEILLETAARELSGYAAEGAGFTVAVFGGQTKAEKEFVFGKAGDADEDGVIGTNDLLIIRKLIAGLSDAAAFRFHEVKLDGIFNTDDLVALRKIIAGLI